MKLPARKPPQEDALKTIFDRLLGAGRRSMGIRLVLAAGVLIAWMTVPWGGYVWIVFALALLPRWKDFSEQFGSVTLGTAFLTGAAGALATLFYRLALGIPETGLIGLVIRVVLFSVAACFGVAALYGLWSLLPLATFLVAYPHMLRRMPPGSTPTEVGRAVDIRESVSGRL